jgi:uncharacterized membrane protein
VAHHVAIAYPDHARAKEVVAALKRLEAEGVVELKKAVAVLHDRDRKLGVAQILTHTVAGIVAGAGVGVLMGLAFDALGLGTLIGAIVGSLCGIMIAFARSDEPEAYGFGSFGQQVAASLPDGGAAVLMLVRKHDPDKAIATLQQYGGRVLRTTLPDDIEARLLTAVNQPAQAAA